LTIIQFFEQEEVDMNKNITSKMIQPKNIGSIVFLVTICLVFMAGCSSHNTYNWTEYRIQSNRITTSDWFVKENSVSIINAQPNDTPVILGAIGGYILDGSLKQLTDSIIAQLTRELTKRKITVSRDASKTLEIKVESTGFEQGVWKVRANLNVHLQAGKSYAKDFLVSNSTPTTLNQAFDGAIALAVIDILNNPDILKYLQE
jgi:hypothetical protein